MSEWQPINTAPHNDNYYGDEIILFGGEGHVYFGHWFKGKWYRRDCADLMICEPTHWMPLPQPPTLKVNQGDYKNV